MERPILFSTPMVQAILSGRKTQTRRVAKTDDGYLVLSRERDALVCCELKENIGPWWHPHGGHPGEPMPHEELTSPFGKITDRLWVREAFQLVECLDGRGVEYRADGKILEVAQNDDTGDWYLTGNELHDVGDIKWRPSIHMPRWASRIELEITDVKVERLNSISEDDAQKEGFHGPYTGTDWLEINQIGKAPSECFAELWEKINGPGSWTKNPWVWVIDFRRIK